MKVSLFVPCLVDQFLPEIGEATAQLLTRLGARVDYDPRQTCCGQPLVNAGRTREAGRAARRFLDIMEGSEYVVAPSGSCVHTVKKHYPELLAGTPDHRRALGLADRTYELSDFLVNVLKAVDRKDPLGPKADGSGVLPKITYHHSCHVIRGLGISAEPRLLLGSLAGVEVVPLMNEDVCCGFGGEFATLYPEISGEMVKEKVDAVTASGARYLVLAEPGCILNIRGYVHRNNLPIEVIHLAQLLTRTSLSGETGVPGRA
jgi:L-lactate dehydrogenase complex protein LldE